MAKERIFILEDEALIAEEIASTLELLGYQVVGRARSADAALDKLKSLQPDLALLDINVKGIMTGIDVAKIIREKYEFPYIYLTSYSDTATLEQVKPTMPYGYIVKPFTDKDLKSTIEIALFNFAQDQKDVFPTQDILNKDLISKLSSREYDIYKLLFEGLTYKEVAEKLFISINTVKSYQKTLFSKLGVKSRSEAVRKVFGE